MDKQNDDYKVALFLCRIGPEGANAYNSFNLTPDNTHNLTAIIKEIEKYAIGHGDVNETYERFIFNSQDQLEGKAVHEYVTQLRDLAQIM